MEDKFILRDEKVFKLLEELLDVIVIFVIVLKLSKIFEFIKNIEQLKPESLIPLVSTLF